MKGLVTVNQWECGRSGELGSVMEWYGREIKSLLSLWTHRFCWTSRMLVGNRVSRHLGR